MTPAPSGWRAVGEAVLEPDRRRRAVSALQGRFGVSERRACRLTSRHRSSQRYRRRRVPRRCCCCGGCSCSPGATRGTATEASTRSCAARAGPVTARGCKSCGDAPGLMRVPRVELVSGVAGSRSLRRPYERCCRPRRSAWWDAIETGILIPAVGYVWICECLGDEVYRYDPRTRTGRTFRRRSPWRVCLSAA
jgi:hypothetical protein